uniref:Uncharacterized protein n=1 Tax=Mola mola TaxID=94237 RepID=A0A3Q3XJ48_MOLML
MQDQTSDGKSGEKTAILRDFRLSFFAMSRLALFPWTVSETGGRPLVSPDVWILLFVLQPGGEAVSLLENVALISEGTTGLVTWEAALYLAEWALDHRQTFTGRTVLELGSGVGLTGITICRSCSPSRYVFSDCHPGVLQRLRNNVRLNGLTERASPPVSVQEVDWAAATEEQLKQIRADSVIAADVVYDPDVVYGLVKLLSDILRWSSPDVIVCSTVRNPETYGGFKQQLEKAGIGHHVITGPVRHVFPYNRVSAIEMIRLHTAVAQ